MNALTAQLEQAGISPQLAEKWAALSAHIEALGSAAVAYSGGVDSSLLAYITHRLLGGNMTAVLVNSLVSLPGQTQQAAQFAAQHEIPLAVLPFEPLQLPEFRANPAERCYTCKHAILQIIWQHAHQHQLQSVLDGQNLDDLKDYRPGRRAVTESGAISPLAEHQLTKADIRWLAHAFGLSVWNQPSAPCLATRFPYGTPLTEQNLRQAAAAETFLTQKGLTTFRVRCHGDSARIEIVPRQFEDLLAVREEIVHYFKQIGFLTVSLDLQGYRQGSLNEGLTS